MSDLSHEGFEPFWCGQQIRKMSFNELRDTHAAIKARLMETHGWRERCDLAMAMTFCVTMAHHRQREMQEGLIM